MSVKVMSAVFERYPVGRGRKSRAGEMLLALALADVARDDGVLMINDSVRELARKTRQTERGVQLQLRHMEAIGWLARTSASDGGRCRVSIYRINAAWIGGAELPDLAPDGAPLCACETPNQTTGNPELSSGVAIRETPNQTTGNPELSSGAIEPLKPKRLIHPPTPQGGLQARPVRQAKEPGQNGKAEALMTLSSWLADCAARGEKPLPGDDPVWAYAASVGISDEIVALHWWAFKRRRLQAAKKQRGTAGWRQTFRNSVEGNWFRLWWLQDGPDGQGQAALTTVGLQAMAARSAERVSAAALAEAAA